MTEHTHHEPHHQTSAPAHTAAPAPAPVPVAAPVQQIQYIVTEKSLKGIGGWLIFWMILFALAGIGYISIFFNTLGSSSGSAITTLLFAPILAIGFVTSVVLIAMAKKLGRVFSIVTLGVSALYSVVNILVAASNTYFKTEPGTIIGGILISLVVFGLTILYFVASKRVQQTLVK